MVDDRSLSYDVTTKGAYNAAGQRIEKEIWSDEGGTDQLIDTTKYFYTGSSVLYTTDDSNIIKTDNILDLGGNIVASWRDRELGSEDVYFYNYDIRGSVTNIVTTSGGTEKGYAYDEFGNAQVSGSTSFLNETGYTGSILDDSTGLVYMNARFYDPSTGRFLSQDTYFGSAYQPWTQHLYSYCGNNPANYVDPTGHTPGLLAALAGVGAYKAAAAAVAFVASIPVVVKAVERVTDTFDNVVDNIKKWLNDVAKESESFPAPDAKPAVTPDEKLPAQPNLQLPQGMDDAPVPAPVPKPSDPPDDDQTTRYWSARINGLDRVERIVPLTYDEASGAINTGTNVVCINKIAADVLVPKALYPERVLDIPRESDPSYYLPHYHLTRKSKGHIWWYE